MVFPEVKLKLVLEIDNMEEIIDSIDFSEVIEDLLKENGEFTVDQIKNYVLENNPHIEYDT